ncbi:MAG: 3-hydroxyacyl-CoA dehydrogenase NAD-binding domain-containing protein [Gemmatimonadaceae bacterium]
MIGESAAVGVVGAGAMGAGIAQVALAKGHPVVLTDAQAGVLKNARDAIARALQRDAEKGRMPFALAASAMDRLTIVDPADGPAGFARCELVIEAIVERLEVKRATFGSLESVVRDTCVLATNTSSLSVASIAGACKVPERVLGVHFFNPAPVMPLVEIVPGIRTDAQVVSAVRARVDAWGKSTVVAADTPGFIVNRIARPFYGESLRLFEEGEADMATIDWAMRELGGFRMGPFELMDFIGHDINYVVTESVWRSMYYDPRYRPSLTQQRLVEAGLLGRKTGRGFYDWAEGAQRPEPVRDDSLGRRLLSRVLSMLVNEAADAVHLRIASAADIEVAMTRGVNYPKGLLSWGNDLGPSVVLAELDRLQEETGEERYRASPLLRRCAREGRPLPT